MIFLKKYIEKNNLMEKFLLELYGRD